MRNKDNKDIIDMKKVQEQYLNTIKNGFKASTNKTTNNPSSFKRGTFDNLKPKKTNESRYNISKNNIIKNNSNEKIKKRNVLSNSIDLDKHEFRTNSLILDYNDNKSKLNLLSESIDDIYLNTEGNFLTTKKIQSPTSDIKYNNKKISVLNNSNAKSIQKKSVSYSLANHGITKSIKSTSAANSSLTGLAWSKNIKKK